MKTRLYYHLTHKIDDLMIEQTQINYNLMSEERKLYIRELIVSTPDTCSGRTRLKGHRIEIELLIYDSFVYKENCYEVDDYTENDIKDICIVWFFENWIYDEHYKLNDYNVGGKLRQ